jgi:hypothetical protein
MAKNNLSAKICHLLPLALKHQLMYRNFLPPREFHNMLNLKLVESILMDWKTIRNYDKILIFFQGYNNIFSFS